MSNTLHAIVGLLLLTAPASLGVATYSDNVTVPYLEGSGEANETEGEVVESFEASFDEPIETGVLDLRIDHGQVKVVGWEKNAYKVEVIQTPTEDDRTTVEFTDDSEGSELNLSVIVDRQRQSGAHVDAGEQEVGEDHVDKAIVAHVPASATYESVYACEGQESMVSETIEDGLSRVPGIEEHDDKACVPAGDQPEMRGSIQIDADDDDQTLNITWGAIGLDGEQLTMRADYGDIQFEELDFETIEVVTDYGDLSGQTVTAEKAKLVTDYGDITIDQLDVNTFKAVSDYGDLQLDGTLGETDITTQYGDVDLTGDVAKGTITTDHGEITVNGTFDKGSMTTDYGDVILRLTPTETGALDVTSDHGAISAFVPKGEDYGYDVTAATDHGDVVVGLEDASTEGDNASAEDEDDHDDGETVHAKTENFEERAVQLTLDLDTDYGDVWVTHPDETVEASSDDDDGEEGSSGTGQSSGLIGQHGTLVE